MIDAETRACYRPTIVSYSWSAVDRRDEQLQLYNKVLYRVCRLHITTLHKHHSSQDGDGMSYA